MTLQLIARNLGLQMRLIWVQQPSLAQSRRCYLHESFFFLLVGVSGWMFLLVPAELVSPRQRAIIQLCVWIVYGLLIIVKLLTRLLAFAFSALTLLVGRQEERPACRNWVMRCRCDHLSGVRCTLFTYGSADATASQNPTVSCLI